MNQISTFYSEEDEGYISTFPENPNLSAFGKTTRESIRELKQAYLAAKEVLASEKATQEEEELKSKKQEEAATNEEPRVSYSRSEMITLAGEWLEKTGVSGKWNELRDYGLLCKFIRHHYPETLEEAIKRNV